MNNKNYPLIHPGEILREELLKPHELTTEQLAKNIKVEKQIIEDLVAEKSNITADLAVRLACYFQIGADFWINCQRDYDAKLSESFLNNRKIQEEIKPLKTDF